MLEKCVPILSLDVDAKDVLLQQCEFRTFLLDQRIFSIGDDDNYYLYLIEGEVELFSKDGKKTILNTESRQSLHPIANLKPRLYTAKAIKNDTVVAFIQADILNKLLIWEQSVENSSNNLEIDEIFSEDSAENNAWKMSMLQTDIFLTLPAAKISSLFNVMECISLKAGERVITQGEEGEHYYMIKSGRCRVSRNFANASGEFLSGVNEVTLNELVSSESFGEEALVSGEPRNANVTMITDGELMRLSKENFQKMLQEPLLHWVDVSGAKKLIEQGATPIDVRMEEEYANSGIKNTINIPLYLLRISMRTLDEKEHYLLFCDTGARSSAAAFLLIQSGFKHVSVLKGGLQLER